VRGTRAGEVDAEGGPLAWHAVHRHRAPMSTASGRRRRASSRAATPSVAITTSKRKGANSSRSSLRETGSSSATRTVGLCVSSRQLLLLGGGRHHQQGDAEGLQRPAWRIFGGQPIQGRARLQHDDVRPGAPRGDGRDGVRLLHLPALALQRECLKSPDPGSARNKEDVGLHHGVRAGCTSWGALPPGLEDPRSLGTATAESRHLSASCSKLHPKKSKPGQG